MPTYKQILKRYPHFNYLDIELLLAHALKKTRAFLLVHLENKIFPKEFICFQYYLWQYSRGYSVAAITHHKEFFGLDFFVNKYTLVPRPDTEILVEAVLEKLSRLGRDKLINATLIDVGTGSGCIPIAILKTAKNKAIKCFAIDISQPALKIAKKNAKKHNVDITFLQGNLLEPITNVPYSISPVPLFITANLPYLTQEQFTNEPSIQHEPHSAFVADDSGLALYKKLLEQIKTFFSNSSASLFMEIDPLQTITLSKNIKTIFPNAKIEIKKDLAGRDRILSVEL